MSSYKLTYFNARGRAEVTRWLLALAKQDYVDERLTREEWLLVKPNSPFGQLPMLTVDGVQIAQGCAISRLIAKLFGFAGESDLDQAKVDMLVDTVDDLIKPLATIKFQTPDEDKKAELLKKFMEETLPTYLGNFEKQVSESGYFVGNGVTFADISFVMASFFIADIPWDNFPKLKVLKEKVVSLPEIVDWVAKRPETPM